MKSVVFAILLLVPGLAAFSHAKAGIMLAGKPGMQMPGTADVVTPDSLRKGAKDTILASLNKIQRALYKISEELDEPKDDHNIEAELDSIRQCSKVINRKNNALIKEELGVYNLYTKEFLDKEDDRVPLKKGVTIPYELEGVLRQYLSTYGEQTRSFNLFIQAIVPAAKDNMLLKRLYDTTTKISGYMAKLPKKIDLDTLKKIILADNTDTKSKIKSTGDKIQIVRDTADYIKNLLKPAPSSAIILGAAAYQNNIFSANLLIRINRVMDRGAETEISHYFGVQVILPIKSRLTSNSYSGQSSTTSVSDGKITVTTTGSGTGTIDDSGNVTVKTTGTGTGTLTGTITTTTTTRLIQNKNSTNLKDPGLFLMYGLRDSKLLLQAGIGYFKDGKEQDVSWMGSLMYIPQKFGIGASYSPLTGLGLQIAIRF